MSLLDMDFRLAWLLTWAHLWQSTLVVALVFVASFFLRRAPARLMYWLWLGALVKFLLPLPLLGKVSTAILRLVAGENLAARAAEIDFARYLAPSVSASPGELGLWQDPFALLFLTWLSGAACIAAVWLRNGRRYRVERGRVDQPDPSLLRTLHDVADHTGVHRRNIRLTSGRRSPQVVGLVRPRIVLPAILVDELEASELRAILLHEEAHRRRRDPLLGAVQAVAFLLFYYFPPFWFVLKRVEAAREMSCDDHAIEQGVPRETYTRALATTISLCLRPPVTTVAAGRSVSLLRRRLQRIGEGVRTNASLRQVASLIAVWAIVIATSVVPLSSAIVPSTWPEQPTPLLAGTDGVTVPQLIQAFKWEPRYPDLARISRLEGKVILQAVIQRDGTVREVEVLNCDRPGIGFEEAAADAVRRWRYTPALKNGVPVDVYFTIRVDFDLK